MSLIDLKYETNEVGLMMELMVFLLHSMIPHQPGSHQGLSQLITRCRRWFALIGVNYHCILLHLWTASRWLQLFQCNVEPTFRMLMKRHLSQSRETRALSSDLSANPEATNDLLLCTFNNACIFLKALEDAFRSFTTVGFILALRLRGERVERRAEGEMFYLRKQIPVKV